MTSSHAGSQGTRPGVAILIADVSREVRRLERMVGSPLPLTPALAFWALHRAETGRCRRGIPSEAEAVHEALRALVPEHVH